MTDVLIVGGGPAGLTASIYAARAGLTVTVAERQMAGGQMITTAEIVNYPGFPEITGPELSRQMETQARKLGVSFVSREVTGLTLTPGALAVTTAKETLPARALILAMGAQRRKLDIPGEDAFTGRGVSYCAVCDGGFFRGKRVAVVGGGNSALEDALYLSGICEKVTLIHRRDVFRGGKALAASVKEASNVEFNLSCVPEAVEGERSVERILVRHLATDEVDTLPVSALFVAVGTVPATALLRTADNQKGLLPLDAEGRVTADESGHTEIPGVFVAGDLRKKALYQIVTACADGAHAASAAAEFLAGH